MSINLSILSISQQPRITICGMFFSTASVYFYMQEKCLFLSSRNIYETHRNHVIMHTYIAGSTVHRILLFYYSTVLLLIIYLYIRFVSTRK